MREGGGEQAGPSSRTNFQPPAGSQNIGRHKDTGPLLYRAVLVLLWMSWYESQLGQKRDIVMYKEQKESKLGLTFYRHDPQENAVPDAAIISRIGATGLAVGKLNVGERIVSVQGVVVQGPLHAARLLRESEGYLRIGMLPKRHDFDQNYEKYARIDAENARKAMEAALPGQVPQSTPRTEAATPRASSASSTPLLTGLRVINGPGAPESDISKGAYQPSGLSLALDAAGANVEAMKQVMAQSQKEIQSNLGNISARAGKFFGGLAAALPTQENRRNRAALRIQKAFRVFAARGQFHEERGAILMLQAASRRRQAQAVVKQKRAVDTMYKDANASKIQRLYRRRLEARAKARAAQQATAETSSIKSTGSGILSKLSRSLSFSKRKGKDTLTRLNEDEADLQSSGGGFESGGGSAKKRSLSFTRRAKKATHVDEVHEIQNV